MQYVGTENSQRLMQIIKKYYEVSEEYSGKLYFGMIFYWNYKYGMVYMSILVHIEEALKK